VFSRRELLHFDRWEKMLCSRWSNHLIRDVVFPNNFNCTRYLSSSLSLFHQKPKKIWRRGDIFLPVEKKDPSSSSVVSNSLLVRGGFIRKLGQGVHSMLPFGHRVMDRLKHIIVEELEAVGGQQVSLPLLHPRSLWDKTNRWEAAGQELFKVTDRHNSEHCLAPTHEEVITSIIGGSPPKRSALPILLFQIGKKFRDEIRPRFGVARGKEFEMLDLYSFDVSEEDTRKTYQVVSEAFQSIFRRMNLDVVVADAQSGNISDKPSQEFHVLSSSMGEDQIVHCEKCKYTANLEKAESKFIWGGVKIGVNGQNQLFVSKKGEETVLSDFEQLLNTGLKEGLQFSLVKGLSFYNATTNNKDNIVIVVVPQRRDPNFDKVTRLSGVSSSSHPFILFTATQPTDTDEFFSNMKKFNKKNISPLPVIIDQGVFLKEEGERKKGEEKVGWFGGETREVLVRVGDVQTAQNGDVCKKGGVSTVKKGIEIGHIFHLGTKYSSALGAIVKGPDTKPHPMDMGCYGIGVSRLMAAIVELNHDEKGMKWPFEVAPFKCAVVTVGKEERIHEEGEKITRLLMSLPELGDSVLLDDRNDSPGFKFTESELVGYPFVVVVGKSFQTSGEVEVWERSTGNKTLVLPEILNEFISEKIALLRKRQ